MDMFINAGSYRHSSRCYVTTGCAVSSHPFVGWLFLLDDVRHGGFGAHTERLAKVHLRVPVCPWGVRMGFAAHVADEEVEGAIYFSCEIT